MALIQCKLGPGERTVGSDTYAFRVDEHGRAVAEVQNLAHQICFLSVEHYLIAPELANAPASEPQAVLDPDGAPPSPLAPPQPTATPVAPARRGKRRQG